MNKFFIFFLLFYTKKTNLFWHAEKFFEFPVSQKNKGFFSGSKKLLSNFSGWRKKKENIWDKSLLTNNPYANINNGKNIPDLNKRNFIKKGILGLAAGIGIAAFSKIARAGGINFADETSQSAVPAGHDTRGLQQYKNSRMQVLKNKTFIYQLISYHLIHGSTVGY